MRRSGPLAAGSAASAAASPALHSPQDDAHRHGAWPVIRERVGGGSEARPYVGGVCGGDIVMRRIFCGGGVGEDELRVSENVVGAFPSRAADEADSARSTASSEWIMLAFLAFGVLVAYIALERGQLVSWDGQIMASVGRNIWQHQSLTKCCKAFGADPADTSKYSKYGIGYSLLLAPFWGLQLHFQPEGALFLGLANPLLLVGSTLALARTGLILGWRRSTAVVTSLAFSLLTMAVFYSTSFLAEPGVTFGFALAILGFAIWRDNPRRGAVYIGIGLAIAILVRSDSVVLCLPIFPCLFVGREARKLLSSWRTWAFALLAPVVLAVGWVLYYNHVRYGSFTGSGYTSAGDRQGFSTPLLRGLGILLWSPGKSFFVYSPVLLLGVPGLYFLARRRLSLATTIVLLCIVRVCFFARWWTPIGGAIWGPRFLMPMCLLLAIPLGETIERMHTSALRVERFALAGSLATLAALSAIVQFASVAVPYKQVISQVDDIGHTTGAARLALRTQQMHRYVWTFGGSHVVRNLAEARKAHFSAAYFFAGGPSRDGLSLLLLAALGCGGAFLLSILKPTGSVLMASPVASSSSDSTSRPSRTSRLPTTHESPSDRDFTGDETRQRPQPLRPAEPMHAHKRLVPGAIVQSRVIERADDMS